MIIILNHYVDGCSRYYGDDGVVMMIVIFVMVLIFMSYDTHLKAIMAMMVD